jgi:hypothetical protein
LSEGAQGGRPQEPAEGPGGSSAEQGGAASEEELRARLEEELKRITVRDILLQTVVTLVNLGGQRLGLSPETRELRDLEQARTAIEGVRSLLPLLESDPETGPRLGPVRDALAQLQMAYANEAAGATPPGGSGAGGEGEAEDVPRGGAQERGAPGGRTEQPKPRSGGRLWVPPGSTG